MKSARLHEIKINWNDLIVDFFISDKLLSELNDVVQITHVAKNIKDVLETICDKFLIKKHWTKVSQSRWL